DIDGLRALSVLLVLAFHLGGISGGFIGVDVFFVISGFLITGMIREAVDAGAFSFGWFYQRRARRILPALLLVVTATAAAGFVLLLPGDYQSLAKSALYATVGASNFFFLFNTGYFDAPASSMALLHTWSLGVEEQFYLLWPAFLWLVSGIVGKSRRAWSAVFLAVIVASFAAAAWQVTHDPKAAFFLPHTRAWELALGGLLAVVPSVGHR